MILSAEIIAITLGTVAGAAFLTQLGALAAISALMTVGVYGLVAGIVKLDDAGLALSRRTSAAARGTGRAILRAAPWLMKGLAIAGTAAKKSSAGGSRRSPRRRAAIWPRWKGCSTRSGRRSMNGLDYGDMPSPAPRSSAPPSKPSVERERCG